jgi:hypothetical protein
LAWFSQRRGVTPLVMFTILSGHRRSKSAKMVCFISWVWIAATPFTLWLPTMARWAMRMRLPLAISSISDMR